MAFELELSTFSTALVPLFQPTIVPSSVEKMNLAGAFDPTRKPEVLLKIIPVGADGGAPPAGGGIFTINDCGVPLLLYKVESPV